MFHTVVNNFQWKFVASGITFETCQRQNTRSVHSYLMMNVFSWLCLDVYTKKSSPPHRIFPAFALMINWVMVHVANSPRHPQRDGCDRTDRPAITGSCETQLGLLPTTVLYQQLSLFPHPATIMSHQAAVVWWRGWQRESIKHDGCRFMDVLFYFYFS